MATKKKQSFEEQLAAVENLIARMESGGLPLEEAMAQYEDGMQKIAALEKELKGASQRLTVIRQNARGEDEEVPMEDCE